MFLKPLPNNADRARWASTLLMLNLCLFAVQVICNLLKLFGERMYYSFYGYAKIGELILGLAQSMLMITTAVFFIMWFRRAYNNLHISGARFLPYSEGWAAGAWFVPIIFWFYPYRIMNAIWIETPSAIRKTGEQYERPEDNPVGTWWTFWVIGNIVSNIHSQLVIRRIVDVDDSGMVVLEMISEVALLIAAWVGMKMVKRVAEMEADLQVRYNGWVAYQQQLQAQQYGYQQNYSTAASPFSPPAVGQRNDFPPQQ